MSENQIIEAEIVERPVVTTSTAATTQSSQQTTLAKREPTAVAVSVATPEQLAANVARYRAMQAVLDQAMPDCIMEIQGKRFRKKAYWRALANGFGISLDLVSERMDELAGNEYVAYARYRATLPCGTSCVGDGACESREKSGKMKTRHNVAAHAHTRAKNRAISDLVGFGEVSAEEVEREILSDVADTAHRVLNRGVSQADCWAFARGLGLDAPKFRDLCVRAGFDPADKATHLEANWSKAWAALSELEQQRIGGKNGL